MRRTAPAVIVTAALCGALSACGSDNGTVVSDALSADAPPDCPDMTSATIGRCARSNGDPCTSAMVAGNHFEAVAEGAESPLVVGLQGLTMMPMAVRVDDIIPDGGDDPSKHPLVSGLLLGQDGLNVAAYFNSVPFTMVSGETDRYEMIDIFLIFSVDPTPVAGEPTTVRVRVTDSVGEIRCGELNVIAGEL